jgi:hypothetical protein
MTLDGVRASEWGRAIWTQEQELDEAGGEEQEATGGEEEGEATAAAEEVVEGEAAPADAARHDGNPHDGVEAPVTITVALVAGKVAAAAAPGTCVSPWHVRVPRTTATWAPATADDEAALLQAAAPAAAPSAAAAPRPAAPPASAVGTQPHLPSRGRRLACACGAGACGALPAV